MNTTKDLNNNWRKVASAIYTKPHDSKIFGSVEIDVTELDDFIKEKRRQGLKITLTHFFTIAVARGLKTEVPEFNTYLRRGRILPRNQVDAMVSVLMKDQQLGSVKVPNADQFTLAGLVHFMNEAISKSKSGDENQVMKKKNVLAMLPWPFRNWAFRLYKLISINWGFKMPFINLSANEFGSFVLTNIGSLGLDMGIPALFPSSNVALVFVLGGDCKKPVVINDQIVIRKILALGATIDHRLADGSHGAILFRYLKHVVKNPHLLESEFMPEN
jgi:pyruvate/2-oxoglutarate dehydrogenase complex dihydrolipoamide acyltransferase (E2) component